MQAPPIPLLLHFLNFPISEGFATRYRNKLEELKRGAFVDQNYGAEDERAYKFVSRMKHHFYDEISIIESVAPEKTKYVWKEFFVDERSQLFEIIAICELRKELQAEVKRGLPPLHRYMHKKVPHGWISSRYRIRVLLEWVDKPSVGEMISKSSKLPTALLRSLFVGCSYDETNQQQPFRLMDRLVDGVEPIQRISQSKSKGWTSYCHQRIWEIYGKGTEEAIRNEFNRLLRGMDIHALAMIVLQAATMKDFSLLYVFNGRFNQQLLESHLDQLFKEREHEDESLCTTIKSILLHQNLGNYETPLTYQKKIIKNPPAQLVSASQATKTSNPQLTTQADSQGPKPQTPVSSPPVDQQPPEEVPPRESQIDDNNRETKIQADDRILSPEIVAAPQIAINKNLNSQGSQDSTPKVAQEIIKEMETDSKLIQTQNPQDSRQKSASDNQPQTSILENPETRPLVTTSHGDKEQPHRPKPSDKQPTLILGKDSSGNTKERSGCPCCTLI